MPPSFRSLGLPAYLIQTVDGLGWETPTPIQAATIPVALKQRDIVAVAQTGTGKTAAFALPVIVRICGQPPADPRRVQALALAPTRELALQLAAAFQQYARRSPRSLQVLAVIGGEDIDAQIDGLRGDVDVVVATPGRLLDLVERGSIDLSGLGVLILDEADKLLDLGFAEALDAVLTALPAERQNILCTATFPAKVAALSDRFLTEPEYLSVEGEQPVVEKIRQRAIAVDRDKRRLLLQHLLQHEPWNQVLVFVATKVAARNLAAKLRRDKISAAGFHGDLEQAERNKVLRRFKNKSTRVLIATDVAARGIDIDALSCVVNYDLPRSPRDYIHRVGRTGRAGHQGVAISFIDPDTAAHFALIEKRADIALEREFLPGFEPTTGPPARKPGGAPIKGKRKSKKDKLREAAAKAAEGASGADAKTETNGQTPS